MGETRPASHFLSVNCAGLGCIERHISASRPSIDRLDDTKDTPAPAMLPRHKVDYECIDTCCTAIFITPLTHLIHHPYGPPPCKGPHHHDKHHKKNKKTIRHNGVPKRPPHLAARVAQVMLTIAAKAISVTKCFRAVTARTSSHPDEPQAPQRGKPGDKFSASSVTAARQNRARYTRRNATVCFPSPVISRTAGSPPRRLAECDKARQAMSSTQTGSP